MREFKLLRGITEKTPVEVPIEDGNNVMWNLDMDIALISVIKHKMSIDQALLIGDTDLRQVNFPVHNCWLRINSVENWGSGNLEMVTIHYQLIELNNRSYDFIYRSQLSDLMNRLTYETV